MNTSVTTSKRGNLERLLRPRHVAYVGGRAAEGGIRGCVEGGFAGPVWAVNPKYDSLGGVPCFKSVADLPEPPDATFISVPREATIDLVAQLADGGAGGAEPVGRDLESGQRVVDERVEAQGQQQGARVLALNSGQAIVDRREKNLVAAAER